MLVGKLRTFIIKNNKKQSFEQSEKLLLPNAWYKCHKLLTSPLV